MDGPVDYALPSTAPLQAPLASFLAGLLVGVLASLPPSPASPTASPRLSTTPSSTTDSSRTPSPAPESCEAPSPTPPSSLEPTSCASSLRLGQCASEEQQYLDLARNILEHGELRPSVKGGAGALALFSPPPLTFSLSRLADPSDPFSPTERVLPLLTTKSVKFDAIREEFAWMLRGCTDASKLTSGIWSANSSRAYLDSKGLDEYDEGDIGPGYGHQWRHFGAQYRGAKENYDGEGVDQLERLIRSIKTEPEKRKHIICAWSPADLDKMALPPCPTFVQFYVHSPSFSSSSSLFSFPPANPRVRLSCAVYQRSADVALGLPFDLVSYALLTHLVALLTDLGPHELTFHLGDAHVYLDHVDGLETQLAREIRYDFPTLELSRSREELERAGGIDAVEEDDFRLGRYEREPRIRFKLHP